MTNLDILGNEDLNVSPTDEEIKDFAKFLIKHKMMHDNLELAIEDLKGSNPTKMYIEYIKKTIIDQK